MTAYEVGEFEQLQAEWEALIEQRINRFLPRVKKVLKQRYPFPVRVIKGLTTGISFDEHAYDVTHVAVQRVLARKQFRRRDARK